MRTGEDVKELGLYVSDCCLQEVLFDTGESFSRCPHCSNLSDWEMVDVASSLEEMHDLKKLADTRKLSAAMPDLRFAGIRHSF